MPKNHAQQHNPPAPEFTSYTLASTKTGEVNAELSRIAYSIDRQLIKARRAERLDGRFWDTRQKPHPVKVRGGYPANRFVNPERVRKRNVPHSNFTNCFKMVEKASGEFKVMVLHATRGWKVFA